MIALLEQAGVWILRVLGADLIKWAIAAMKAWIDKRRRDQERVKEAKDAAQKTKEAKDAESTDSSIDGQLS